MPDLTTARPEFEVVVVHDTDGVVVRPCGDITARTSPTLAMALAELLVEAAPVILDLSHVRTLDAERAWVIDEAARLFRDRASGFTVRGANAAVRDVLDAAHVP